MRIATSKPAPTASSFSSPWDRRPDSAFSPNGDADSRRGTRIVDPTVRMALRRMVVRMEDNPQTREELLQVAQLHLWLAEQQHPGQRLSWYLKGVKFYLLHLRSSGRSLDSPKHRGARAVFAGGRDGPDQWLDTLKCDNGIMSEVYAHDLFSLLADRLTPIDQQILGASFEGLGAREIAKRLRISHQSVTRHRRRIALIAIELGVVRPLPWPKASGPTQ